MRGASLLHRLADASAQDCAEGPAVGIWTSPAHAQSCRQQGCPSRLVRHASVRSPKKSSQRRRPAAEASPLRSFQYRLLYTLACNRLAVRWWNLGRGAPRKGRAGSRRRGFDCRGRDKAMGVGSGASWDKGVVLVCAWCSRRGGAARTGLVVRARRQYKPAAEIHVRARTRALTSTPHRPEWGSMRVCTERENSSRT